MSITVIRWMAMGCFLLNLLVQSVHFVHMLQLNSYRGERYRKWCRDNVSVLFSGKRLLPVLNIAALWLSLKWGTALVAVVFFVTALVNIPKKAKKPLVVTARVKRLFATFTVVAAAVGCLAALLPYTIVWLSAFSLPVWLWVFLANTINTPLEKAIANGYVKDAKNRLRTHPDLTVIGVTGSYGKTSTKTYLQALLSVKYNVLMTPESYNTTMGVVRTVRERLLPSHQIFIAEMGAKNRGDIEEICRLVEPTYGVITSIGEQHLETFKTVENIVATKFELAEALPSEGRLFANRDCDRITAQLNEHAPLCPVTTYGLNGGDVTVTQLSVSNNGTTFTVKAGEEIQAFTTHLLGAHMIQNLVGCIAVAVSLGITLKELVYPIRRLKPVEHRLQLLPNGFIDDAYNANPAGFRAALDVLNAFDAQRVLVTPGMVELGTAQERLNRELGAYAAERCDYAILVGLKQAPPLKEGLLSAGFKEENIAVVPTLQEGLAVLNTLPRADRRIVLLENDLPDNF